MSWAHILNQQEHLQRRPAAAVARKARLLSCQGAWVQVHEEVLRLFTATVGKLSAEQLAKYLQMTLQHSRKSRKCASFIPIPFYAHPGLAQLHSVCVYAHERPGLVHIIAERSQGVAKQTSNHTCVQALQKETG